MYYPLLGITLICYVSAELNRVQIPQKFLQNVLSKSKSNMVPDKDTDAYFDKPDNKMLIPVTPEEIQATKKLFKKHPKSTIQKIIARNKKNKKMKYNFLTTKPTPPPSSDDIEDFDDRDDDPTTMKGMMMKKPKKWNNKITKYHSQIQKMPNRISPKVKRTKRHLDRDNTIIFQDFDEFEFLDNKKDYDLVKTHFKKYW
ncbi:uncharacterized protein LOC125238368 isoform X2 [Leguminivora glycinivorella]|uniref:uncharacterized protein LOC125238368 isoform X2 n=1 Tax=Leguminivora glycinivorella TaxID=1035111 RepID=UPI0020107652|nr:uncharacterized protein LOC125238368 isoform X2 [Leguminivora glycinivorella]